MARTKDGAAHDDDGDDDDRMGCASSKTGDATAPARDDGARDDGAATTRTRDGDDGSARAATDGDGDGDGDGASGTTADAMADGSSAMLARAVTTYEDATTAAMHAAAARVRERWGTTRDAGAAWRFWLAEETTVSALTTPLGGSSIEVGARDDLSVMMCAHDALEAPVGGWEGRVACCPRAFAVDAHLTVDGKRFEDAHACAGEPDYDRERAIEAGLDDAGLYASEAREAARRVLRRERDGGGKPWCTVFGSRFSEGNHFVHLPLIADYLDGAILDPFSKSYAHSLMWRWAEVCEKIGPGEHEVTLRCAPLGVFVPAAGACRLVGYDEAKHGSDKGFKAFLQSLDTEYETSASAAGMSATFTIKLHPNHCAGKKIERRAQEWAPDWPADEIAECYTTALQLANTGPPGAMAAQMTPGATCCHVVLPTTDGHSGIAEVKDRDGRTLYHEFHAWGLFRGVDGELEARTGAQIKFRCVKSCVNGEPTGVWMAKDYDPRPCNGLLLKNKFIDQAIARDDEHIKIPSGVA
jgi:hypothetical protein